MDEVARERASSAHSRLDGINGQIAGLRVAQDKTRDDLTEEITDTREGIYAGMGKLWDAHAEVAQSVAEMRGTFSTALKVAGAVGVAVLAMLGTTVGLLLTRDHAAPRNATQRLEKATGSRGVEGGLASRQRGAHERLAAP